MKDNNNFSDIDALICILAMFFVVWILTVLDNKIWEGKERTTQPVPAEMEWEPHS